MIARLRRLERVRARQLDRARGDQARATMACQQADLERSDAVRELDNVVATPTTVVALEQASERIEAAGKQVQYLHLQHERVRGFTAAAGQAWNRAEQSLGRARAEREADKRRDEQREHDELATRRSR